MKQNKIQKGEVFCPFLKKGFEAREILSRGRAALSPVPLEEIGGPKLQTETEKRFYCSSDEFVFETESQKQRRD